MYLPAYDLSDGTGASDVVETGFKGDAYMGLWLVVRGIEAGAGGTSVVVKLQTASDESFTSPVDLFTSALSRSLTSPRTRSISKSVCRSAATSI